ncbi:hypothetical protein GGI06_000717 [Coemansia sp. S85]|nr:hypothetical protein GGI06_000717 [Coemansia sp. S85]
MFGAPIGHLISERFYGPTPLRALSIVNFGFPNRETLYQYQTVAPIAIVCLYINHFDCTPSLQLPPVLAGSLVEVSLKPVVPKRVWDPFVADGLQGSPGDKLVFFRLQSLLLGFLDESLLISGAGVDGRIQEIDSSMLPYDGTPRFMRSATVGSLAFPQLTSLEIRHFCLELADFLSIFAASPISKLALVLSDSSLPFNGDLLEFTGLHSFAVQIPRISGLSDMLPVLSCLSRMFVAVSPHLQSQTIELSICRGYKFGALDAGSFKESLVSLTLKCQIKPEELDVVLGGYPNLKKLYLHSAVSQPISSTPSLVNMLRSLCAGAIRAPVCQHLRFLSAQNLRHYKYSSLPSSASIKPATVATEVALYRGLLRSLVCRLPLLVTFQVSATAFDGIYKCINVLVQVLLQSIKAFFGT